MNNALNQAASRERVKALMALADEYAAAERATECATDNSTSAQERAALESALLASHTGEAEPAIAAREQEATATWVACPECLTGFIAEEHTFEEATPLAATPAAPGGVTLNKKDLNKLLNDFARACAFGDDLLARMATSKAIHEYLDAAFAALSHPAPVAAPAPGLAEVMRSVVAALPRYDIDYDHNPEESKDGYLVRHEELIAEIESHIAALPQPTAVQQAETLAELRRALAAVGVVGQIEGHDVVRRLSVLDVVDDRCRKGGA